MCVFLGSGEYLSVGTSLAFWLEQHGYDVTYCSNVDIERDPDLLKRCKVFLSVGHDEYWTRGMYDNVMAARDRGVSLAFLSGNSVCHVIEPYSSTVTGSRLRAFARKIRFEDEEQLMGVKTYGPGLWRLRGPAGRPLDLRGLWHEERRLYPWADRLGISRHSGEHSWSC